METYPNNDFVEMAEKQVRDAKEAWGGNEAFRLAHGLSDSD